MRLNLKYCCFHDVETVDPKGTDEQKKNRRVTLHVDEEDFFDMLDSVNPKNIIKYLDMRGIQHREPSVVNVTLKRDKTSLRIRHKIRHLGEELNKFRNNEQL